VYASCPLWANVPAYQLATPLWLRITTLIVGSLDVA
jgi:hypothetical protein